VSGKRLNMGNYLSADKWLAVKLASHHQGVV
jgi:hypothetical protein